MTEEEAPGAATGDIVAQADVHAPAEVADEFDLMQLIDQAAAEMVDSDSTVVVDLAEGPMAIPAVEGPVAAMVMEGPVAVPTVEGPMAEGLVAVEGPVAAPTVEGPVAAPTAEGLMAEGLVAVKGPVAAPTVEGPMAEGLVAVKGPVTAPTAEGLMAEGLVAVKGPVTAPTVEGPMAEGLVAVKGPVAASIAEGPMAEGLETVEGPVATPGVKGPVSVEGTIADPAAEGAADKQVEGIRQQIQVLSPLPKAPSRARTRQVQIAEVLTSFFALSSDCWILRLIRIDYYYYYYYPYKDALLEQINNRGGPRGRGEGRGRIRKEWVAEGEIKRKDVNLIRVVPGREKLAGEILDHLGVMEGSGSGSVAESSYVLLQ